MLSKSEMPVALYPSHIQLQEIVLNDYPTLNEFLSGSESWRTNHWQWGKEFLLYIARNKSEHTFTRFRNEVERFLLWLFMSKKMPMDTLKKADILDYADFCWQPPTHWINTVNVEKFLFNNGFYEQNPQWAPFKLQLPKGHAGNQIVDKKKYRPSQQTLTATFTAVIAFYKYLMNEEYLYGNPAQLAKADCRYFIQDAQVKEVRRLTDAQWQYVINIALELADQDSLYERSLFVIVALKVLFLRVSELSERSQWSPIMGHFWQDSDGNWWLKVFGKGRKLRDITVPDSFITYLKRYRIFRGLSPLPTSNDNQPIVEKIRGQGGEILNKTRKTTIGFLK